MVVGSMLARLFIRESRSLKDKRQVLNSIKDRLRNQFNIAIAEVDAHDHRQVAALGIAMVAAEASTVQSCMQEITNALRSHPIAEFLSCETSVQ